PGRFPSPYLALSLDCSRHDPGLGGVSFSVFADRPARSAGHRRIHVKSNARRAIAPIAILALIAGSTATAQTARGPGSPALVKARVSNPRITASDLRPLHGFLIANYESFSVVNIPADQIGRLTAAEMLPDENIVQLNAGGLDTTTAA